MCLFCKHHLLALNMSVILKIIIATTKSIETIIPAIEGDEARAQEPSGQPQAFPCQITAKSTESQSCQSESTQRKNKQI